MPDSVHSPGEKHMSQQHTPGPHRVTVGRKSYTVYVAVDGSVSRVTYTNAVRGETPLALAGRVARAAIAKTQGAAA